MHGYVLVGVDRAVFIIVVSVVQCLLCAAPLAHFGFVISLLCARCGSVD